MADEAHKLLEEMRRTNRLLALLLTKGLKQAQAIPELRRAGFAPKDIAEILGTTPNTVSVALSSMKKKAPKKASAKQS